MRNTRWILLVGIAALLQVAAAELSVAQSDTVTFKVRDFSITGNTIFTTEQLKRPLAKFIGTGKTAEDVEKARTALERYHHERGYPTVLVNIPEQTVDNGGVLLEVIENRIHRVIVKGNEYFTIEYIKSALPSLKPGGVLYIPDLQQDLRRLNRNQNLRVKPTLVPGRRIGSINVEIQVEDRLPLHGSLELNNRGTRNTTDLRLNGLISYDNLWQRDHSVSFQFQVSPEDTEEVNALSGSYVMPAAWDRSQLFVVYGIWSDSDTAFGSGFEVIGKGFIIGARNIVPLPSLDAFAHNVTIGVDYKDFEEDLFALPGAAPEQAPVTYLPFSINYDASRYDTAGVTRFFSGVNMTFRGFGTDPEEFENKRIGARGNYIYATAGIERSQKLPARLDLFAELDGQVSSQPLLSNEQYFAGGMKSVRGYKEAEVSGDNGYHFTTELRRPFSFEDVDFLESVVVAPYAFFDAAGVAFIDAAPGQDKSTEIQGVGLGIRGKIRKHFVLQVDWGVPLSDTDWTEAGEDRVYFLIRAEF